jgi:hypothetical protein
MPSSSFPNIGATKAATQIETIDPEKLYPPKITADLLDMSPSWLAKARLRGDGPRYAKFGRSVKYQGYDIIEYRKSRKRYSTSQA